LTAGRWSPMTLAYIGKDIVNACICASAVSRVEFDKRGRTGYARERCRLVHGYAA
jgi:hypothetical protein